MDGTFPALLGTLGRFSAAYMLTVICKHLDGLGSESGFRKAQGRVLCPVSLAVEVVAMLSGHTGREAGAELRLLVLAGPGIRLGGLLNPARPSTGLLPSPLRHSEAFLMSKFPRVVCCKIAALTSGGPGLANVCTQQRRLVGWQAEPGMASLTALLACRPAESVRPLGRRHLPESVRNQLLRPQRAMTQISPGSCRPALGGCICRTGTLSMTTAAEVSQAPHLIVCKLGVGSRLQLHHCLLKLLLGSIATSRQHAMQPATHVRHTSAGGCPDQ